MADEEKHVDLIGHDWASMRIYLVERRPADEPNAGKSGDYSHYSEPHTMDECPFAEKDVRVMADETERARRHVEKVLFTIRTSRGVGRLIEADEFERNLANDYAALAAELDAAEKERDDARNERGKLGSVVVALEKRNRELLCALAMYAVDEDGNATGGEPATSALNGERCCGEWPECSHGFAFWERISARAAAASGSGE